MGTSTVVERLHPESGVDLTYLSGNAPGDGGDTVQGLDRFGRVVDHYWANFNTPTITDEFVYGYDRNSNRLFRDNVLDPTFGELYSYDNFDQLSDFARGTLSTTSDSIVGTPVRSQDWSPHPLGNASTISTSIGGSPTAEGRTYNAQNQFDTVGGNPLDYDNNGNLILDQDGNVYIYDAWNRLVRVEDSMSTLLTAYSYNALNRRIIEDDGSTETHLFYSANWQVLEEQVASDTTVQYVWSPVYIDAMILRDRDTDANGSLDERLYVQQDANWNVTALVGYNSGTTDWEVVQRFVQDPFGLVTDVLDDSWTPQADAFDWKYLHQGLRLDVAVGMNLYDGRNRIYDPVLHRWLQIDPSGFSAGDSNLYRYVENGPTNFSDPFGLQKHYHHWFPRLGKEKRGQLLIDAKCKCVGVQLDIDDFTTPLEGGKRLTPHTALHRDFPQPLGAAGNHEGWAGYNNIAVGIITNPASDCCAVLKGIVSLIFVAGIWLRNQPFTTPVGEFPGFFNFQTHEPTPPMRLPDLIAQACAKKPPPPPPPIMIPVDERQVGRRRPPIDVPPVPPPIILPKPAPIPARPAPVPARPAALGSGSGFWDILRAVPRTILNAPLMILPLTPSMEFYEYNPFNKPMA